MLEKEFKSYQRRLHERGLRGTQHVVIAAVCEKILGYFQNGKLVFSFSHSSARLGRSCEENSFKTPWGLHSICEKYGDGAPPGMIFKARQSTGKCWHETDATTEANRSLVTTRILRLSGLEPGTNQGPGVDSFARYIYIHGTNHPEQFPDNLSAGCILMRDADLIQLYELLPIGSHVWLSEPPKATP
jgi:hypothetical protein